MNSITEKFPLEKTLFFVAVLAIVLVAGLIIVFYFIFSGKSVQLISPNGWEEWEIGQTYEIKWKAKGIDKVGVVLFQGDKAQWLAKDLPAGSGKLEWKIAAGQEYGPDNWIAVFEYPWAEGNKIDYSKAAFSITFPLLSTCDSLSADRQWLYLASGFPDLRRVFITEGSYNGNLGGLEGADKICQDEAEKQGFGGKWLAFLGGDSDQETAVKRLEKTPKGKEGIFVLAQAAAVLAGGDSCHRLLAKNFEELLVKFYALKIINSEKMEEDFLNDLANLWLGRLDEASKKNCLAITAALSESSKPLLEKYSFTTTCQNWTTGEKTVDGYPVGEGQPRPSFPSCYTPQGKFTEAVASAGLASGLSGKDKETVFYPAEGKSCDQSQKLLCIEK